MHQPGNMRSAGRLVLHAGRGAAFQVRSLPSARVHAGRLVTWKLKSNFTALGQYCWYHTTCCRPLLHAGILPHILLLHSWERSPSLENCIGASNLKLSNITAITRAVPLSMCSS